MLERHELKYLIPYSLVEPISQYLTPYCAYDHHSMTYPDRFYPVNSLYFDTYGLQFLKQRMEGAERRFNMRIRSYGDGISGPYFAEIKFKTANVVKKFRATIEEPDWPDFVTHESAAGLSSILCKESISRNLFTHLANAYAIEPKIFTCYRRRAFSSQIDDYARVTFDMDLRYRPQDATYSNAPYSLSPGSDCINYDIESVFGDEPHYRANVVLELKSAIGTVPLWMIELIRRFELKQVGFSKYQSASLVAHIDNGSHYMDADRQSVNERTFFW